MNNDPRKLIVLGFDSPLKAQEALMAATRLMTEGEIMLHDAVFVSKDVHGETRVKETTDVTPGEAALDGAFWGLLFGTLLAGPVGAIVGGALTAGTGALMAQVIDTGVPDEQVQELRKIVLPGTTALALLVSHVHVEALVRELHRFAGAQIVTTDLPDATVAAVREALVG
ncbi:MAG: DUF1269 domain-containing protein [Deltaproteobacteria bacterium]|nr:DUF1269 domain-containing protein [Myxococcales bacterium]MDP3213651.1 DUF1269 domain-containing protein [Deltaproteobacteria bacterium]